MRQATVKHRPGIGLSDYLLGGTRRGSSPMPIMIRSASLSQTISSEGFSSEEELELLLAKSPDLLREDDGPAIEFVDRQVDLHQAGILDLLFVNSDGLLIAVETKLACNAGARRE